MGRKGHVVLVPFHPTLLDALSAIPPSPLCLDFCYRGWVPTPPHRDLPHYFPSPVKYPLSYFLFSTSPRLFRPPSKILISGCEKSNQTSRKIRALSRFAIAFAIPIGKQSDLTIPNQRSEKGPPPFSPPEGLEVFLLPFEG